MSFRQNTAITLNHDTEKRATLPHIQREKNERLGDFAILRILSMRSIDTYIAHDHQPTTLAEDQDH